MKWPVGGVIPASDNAPPSRRRALNVRQSAGATLPLDDFDDAFRVDHGPFRFTEKRDHVAIFRGAEASGFGKGSSTL
jgi:hypothetical protein